MIDLSTPIADFRANQLRNQVNAIQNVIIQLNGSELPSDVSLALLMGHELRRRMNELERRVAFTFMVEL